MNFSTALTNMKLGKPYRRSSWENKTFRVYVQSSKLLYTDGALNARKDRQDPVWGPSGADLFATDWELYFPPTFGFHEACRRLLAGKRVRRMGWGQNHIHIEALGTLEWGDTTEIPFHTKRTDMEGTDWMEVT